MDAWKKYLLECLADVQAAMDNPTYDDATVQYALYQRHNQLRRWLSECAE